MEISNKSYWIESVQKNRYEMQKGDLECDVVVVGGGIAGITTAYCLQKKGFRTIVIERNEIGSNTTGHTTAKITAQHHLIYSHLIEHFGKEQALQYVQGNVEAIRFIDEVVAKHQIECDLEKKDALIYTTSDELLASINEEYEAYKILGIQGSLINKGLPFEVKAALKWRNQRQFHPIKYVYGLANAFIQLGGQIYEHTSGNQLNVKAGKLETDCGTIQSQYFVIATHYPFYDEGHMYYAKMAPYTNYVGFYDTQQINLDHLNMYINDKVILHSYRKHKNYMLVGGCNHKTGQLKPMIDPKEMINEDALGTYGLKNPIYFWGAEDYVTIDRVPYIGKLNKQDSNVFVATGFGKWGMTSGTLAGSIIEELIVSGKTRYTIFDPNRHMGSKAIGKLVSENINVAKEFVKGKLNYIEELGHLKKGEGGIFLIKHKKIGVYKDLDGKLYGVSVVCPHMKGTLTWNPEERSWDCPIHGSRFNYKGEVIDGPANHSLATIPMG